MCKAFCGCDVWAWRVALVVFGIMIGFRVFDLSLNVSSTPLFESLLHMAKAAAGVCDHLERVRAGCS